MDMIRARHTPKSWGLRDWHAETTLSKVQPAHNVTIPIP